MAHFMWNDITTRWRYNRMIRNCVGVGIVMSIELAMWCENSKMKHLGLRRIHVYCLNSVCVLLISFVCWTLQGQNEYITLEARNKSERAHIFVSEQFEIRYIFFFCFASASLLLSMESVNRRKFSVTLAAQNMASFFSHTHLLLDLKHNIVYEISI